MSTQLRNYIFARRGTGIANLQAVTLLDGELTLEQAEAAGVYMVNCTHQIGIATATEVGLSAERYPIRVVLTSDADGVAEPTSECVAGYWKIVTSARLPLPFTRKPLESDRALNNLCKYVPQLDQDLWEAYYKNKETASDFIFDPAINSANDQLYNILAMVAPTQENVQLIVELYARILAISSTKRTTPYFKIAHNTYLFGCPHGAAYTQEGNLSAGRAALLESVLCMRVNYDRLKRTYDNLSDRAISTASYTIAAMFRHGLAESYEHREYYTMYVSPTANSKTEFRVIKTTAPAGATVPAGIVESLSIDNIKISRKMVELGNLMVVSSGLMHYMFNHTTGGTVMTGSLLTVLSMYQIITPSMPADEQIRITSLFFEALHPCNKRAIANLFFEKSGVSTHGRCSTFRRYERFALDSFTMIRKNPYPAGTRKALICMQALKRVIQAGLAPLLPWADQLSNCIAICKEVLTAGARAHIGSAYYTGEPAIAQPSSIDVYLPELALYVHTFNRGDSLSMSPHMSHDIAKSASMNWQNLMKDLKAKDASATAAELVRKFTFDPDGKSTWGKAIQDAKTAAVAIDDLFK